MSLPYVQARYSSYKGGTMDRKEAIEHGESVLISKKRFANYDWNVKRLKELAEQDLKAFETLLSTAKQVEEVVGKAKKAIDVLESKIPLLSNEEYGGLDALRWIRDKLTEGE